MTKTGCGFLVSTSFGFKAEVCPLSWVKVTIPDTAELKVRPRSVCNTIVPIEEASLLGKRVWLLWEL